jgi:thiol-disulfide isomerase/thioredoxin
MSRNATYKTWGQMNNDPDLKDGQPPGTKSKPKSTITIALKDVNHLKFALKNSRIVVVKAEADWCEPCKVLTPKYEELAMKCSEFKDNFTFFTDDIDSETSYHVDKVTAVPTFFVYTDGSIEPKKTFTGDFDQLVELINRILMRFRQPATDESQ